MMNFNNTHNLLGFQRLKTEVLGMTVIYMKTNNNYIPIQSLVQIFNDILANFCSISPIIHGISFIS